MANEDACSECKFFLPQHQEGGLCRRYPATPVCDQKGNFLSVFPPMMNMGWCGEFKGRVKKVPPKK